MPTVAGGNGCAGREEEDGVDVGIAMMLTSRVCRGKV